MSADVYRRGEADSVSRAVREDRIEPSGGCVCHVWNRAHVRMTIFADEEDFAALEKVLARSRTRRLAYWLMPNCWHLLAWPRDDGELSRFVGWLTLTHTQPAQAQRRATDPGHVYQGPVKSLPIEQYKFLYAVPRSVERKALRAMRASGVGGGPHRRRRGTAKDKQLPAACPSARKANRVDYVHAPPTEAEPAAVRRSVAARQPV